MQNQLTTWIYFIESEDGRYVKIGKSRNVVKRFYGLQTGNPGLRLLGVLPELPYCCEVDIHIRFAASHHEGEWFNQSPDIRDFVKTLEMVTLPPRREICPCFQKRAAQSSLPGFEHVPVEIPTRKGGRMPLLDANYRRVWDYYWLLMKRERERKREDPRIREAKELMDKMQRYASDEKKITVREVLLLEQSAMEG